MSPKEATEYRAVVARLNYIAPDRVDIQYAVKETARAMSAPKRGDWNALMRIGRYLKGKPRLVLKFDWQPEVGTVATFSDSDWAGCKKTGRSTSGGVVTVGKHTLKTYSRQQKTVALSSAEAELHAMVAASAETLGTIALCRDMGIEVRGDVYIDSSAALGIAQRVGSGKVRHVRVQALWVQEIQCNRRLKYKKVLGTRNPSDILTKHVPRELLAAHLQTLGISHQSGRASIAPSLDSVEPYTEEYGHPSSQPAAAVVVAPKVAFSSVVLYRSIPAVGKGRPTSEATKAKAARKQAAGEDGAGKSSGTGSLRAAADTAGRAAAAAAHRRLSAARPQPS